MPILPAPNFVYSNFFNFQEVAFATKSLDTEIADCDKINVKR